MCSNTNIIKAILLLAIAMASYLSHGQQAVTISVFNEATTIPFTTFINTPLHPGMQVGTEVDIKKGNRFRFYPTINLGYMFHSNLFQGIYAKAELGIDFKSSFGLNLKSKWGLGYLHTFATRQEYQLKNGRYESKKDKGNSRFMPSITFGIGYDLRKNDPYSPELFLLYQSWIEYPYSPGFIPIMAHTNIHLGTKIFTTKNKVNR